MTHLSRMVSGAKAKSHLRPFGPTLVQRFFSLELNDEEKQNGSFDKFPLDPITVAQLEARSINYLFPIQAKCFQGIYDGKDVLGKDQTGSGKTLAFLLPTIERMRKENKFTTYDGKPRVLVLCPTRELALQTEEQANLLRHTPSEFQVVACVGGMPRFKQQLRLEKQADLVVGTPGRLLDFISSGVLKLDQVDTIIFDEVDTMLDMGFRADMNTIMDKVAEQLSENGREPSTVQFVMFSATIPPQIREMVDSFMKEDRLFVDMSGSVTKMLPKNITHYLVETDSDDQRIRLAGDLLRQFEAAQKSVLVFMNTKREIAEMQSYLKDKVGCGVLYSDIQQSERSYWLRRFKEKKLRVLLCTNVASRGLDIPDIDIVLQVGLDRHIDEYVHRSGRTGRAGKAGISLSLVGGNDSAILEKLYKVHKVTFKDFQNSELQLELQNSPVSQGNSQADASRARSATGFFSFQRKSDRFPRQSGFDNSRSSGSDRQRPPRNERPENVDGFQVSKVFTSESEFHSQRFSPSKPPASETFKRPPQRPPASTKQPYLNNVMWIAFGTKQTQLTEISDRLAEKGIFPMDMSDRSDETGSSQESRWRIQFLSEREALLAEETLKARPLAVQPREIRVSTNPGI